MVTKQEVAQLEEIQPVESSANAERSSEKKAVSGYPLPIGWSIVAFIIIITRPWWHYKLELLADRIRTMSPHSWEDALGFLCLAMAIALLAYRKANHRSGVK